MGYERRVLSCREIKLTTSKCALLLTTIVIIDLKTNAD